jgi:cyclopropane fatty-acyl-phospholipid synthase-like methyltransferase
MDNDSTVEETKPLWQRRAKQHLLFLSLLLNPSRQRAHAIYDIISTENVLNEQSLYLNMGYWKDAPKTKDAASEAMAKLLAETAGLTSDDRVLDVGFGFGDQDIFWMERFAPKQIVGLNVTRSQVELARRRVAARGLSERVDLRFGSATEMPFEPGTFDKVLALECAFHFQTRERFFQEAYRVLRPGGRIALADCPTLPREGRLNLKGRLTEHLARALTQICKENMYDRHVLREKLTRAGFENVEVTSIYEHVNIPYARYVLKRMSEPDVVHQLYPVFQRIWTEAAKVALNGQADWPGLDYVIAFGDKPRR